MEAAAASWPAGLRGSNHAQCFCRQLCGCHFCGDGGRACHRRAEGHGFQRRCPLRSALQQRMELAREAVRAGRRRQQGDRRSSAPGRSGQPGHAPGLLGRRDGQARRDSPRRALGEEPGQFRCLQAADRNPDRRPALPRLRDAGQFRHLLLDRFGLHRAPALSHADGLSKLDRADARDPALLRRTDGGDAGGPGARLHAAARHAPGPRRLAHRVTDECQARRHAVLHAVQIHARHHSRRRAGEAEAASARSHRRSGAAGLCEAAAIHPRRLCAARAHHARRLRSAGRQGLLPVARSANSPRST